MAKPNPDYIWNLKTQPSDTYGKSHPSNLFLPSGKVLGGSGSINGMLYHRGNDRDYDNWEKLGNPGWEWKNIKSYFNKSLAPGGIVLGQFKNYNPFMDVVEKGAKELGQPLIDGFNEGKYIGYARAKVFASEGKRRNSGKAFLAAAKNRTNLHVVKNSIVKKINFKFMKTAESVEFVTKSGKTITVKAKKEIIISAGTIGTPKLLLLSGVGPAKHLKELGIPLVKDLPVGLNYQDHVRVPLMYSYKDNVEDKVESISNLEKYLLHNTGPLTASNMIFLQGFINSDPKSKSKYPDVQFSHYTSKNVLPSSGYYQTDTILLRPKSRGSVRLASKNYLDDPLIIPNHFHEREDIETVIRGLRYQLKFRKTKAFKEAGATLMNFDLPECRKYPLESDDHLKCYITYMGANCYHSVGTTRMGPETDPNAVVNSALKVHGLLNLRVGDNSIMPNIVSGNTNAPAIMIGEVCAASIKYWNGI